MSLGKIKKDKKSTLTTVCKIFWKVSNKWIWTHCFSKQSACKNHCTAMPDENGTLSKSALLKWGHFDKAKHTLKILLASWTFTVWKVFRSFNAENLGSVCQRAASF